MGLGFRAVLAGVACASSVFLAAEDARALLVENPHRVYACGSLAVAIPVGEFSNFVNIGGGVEGFASASFDRRALLGLRLDGSLVLYGSETRRVPLSETVNRVFVDVTTDNYIASLTVGPQVTIGQGGVRSYAFGGVGFSYFSTQSSVSGSHDADKFASTTNFDDFTMSLATGAGLWVQITHQRSPLFLDFGVRYVLNGRARYL